MRGLFFAVVVSGALLIGAAPAMAAPVQRGDANDADCTDQPVARKKLVKSMTEPVPLRKKDRERTRRILM